jgi:hypothetical protein
MYERFYRSRVVKIGQTEDGVTHIRIPGFVRGTGENAEAMSAAYWEARKTATAGGASDAAAHEAGLAAGKAILAPVRSANLAKGRAIVSAKAKSKRLAKARAARAVKAKREKRQKAKELKALSSEND